MQLQILDWPILAVVIAIGIILGLLQSRAAGRIKFDEYPEREPVIHPIATTPHVEAAK